MIDCMGGGFLYQAHLDTHYISPGVLVLAHRGPCSVTGNLKIQLIILRTALDLRKAREKKGRALLAIGLSSQLHSDKG